MSQTSCPHGSIVVLLVRAEYKVGTDLYYAQISLGSSCPHITCRQIACGSNGTCGSYLRGIRLGPIEKLMCTVGQWTM